MNGYRFSSFVHHFSATRLEFHPALHSAVQRGSPGAEPCAEPRAAVLPCSPTPTCESPPAQLTEPQVTLLQDFSSPGPDSALLPQFLRREVRVGLAGKEEREVVLLLPA